MPVGAGLTISAADIAAIKAGIDALLTSTGAVVPTQETTASTSYTDLATVGPAVTLTTGTLALVYVAAKMGNTTAGATSTMGFAVSGATTIAATANRPFQYESSNANDEIEAGRWTLVTLTAGSNTFTAKYLASAGTSSFQHRTVFVIPLGAS